jgi:hypothetical protein
MPPTPDQDTTLSEIHDVEDVEGQETEDDADLDDAPDDASEGDEDADEGDDEDGDEPLREEGKKALDRMKAANKELRKQLRELKATVAERNADDEDADELTRAQHATEAATSRAVAAEKQLAALKYGLPDSWAARLQGDDLDDFLEDAEALAADMPAPESRKGGGGAKEGHRKRKEPSLDDQIAEAEKKQDYATARRLKAQKVHALREAV